MTMNTAIMINTNFTVSHVLAVVCGGFATVVVDEVDDADDAVLIYISSENLIYVRHFKLLV